MPSCRRRPARLLLAAAAVIMTALLLGGCAKSPNGRYTASRQNFDNVISPNYGGDVTDVRVKGDTVTFFVPAEYREDFTNCLKNAQCGAQASSESLWRIVEKKGVKMVHEGGKWLEQPEHRVP